MGEIIQSFTGGAAKKERKERARQARAASARQLSAAAKDNARADKTSNRGGRKVPGSSAFAFLKTPTETLG